jgi:hypothetical protein
MLSARIARLAPMLSFGEKLFWITSAEVKFHLIVLVFKGMSITVAELRSAHQEATL